MKVQGLLVAVVALVVLAGLVYWSNSVEDATGGQDPDAPPKVLEIPTDTIAKISIRKAGREPVVVERAEGGSWKLTAPQPRDADQDAVNGLVATVSSLPSSRLLEDASDKKTYGLDVPQLDVVVTTRDGSAKKLLIGDETPTGSSFYAMVDGDPRIFTIAEFNKTGVEKTPWDLLDKRLVRFDPNTLATVELTARGQTIGLARNTSHEWQIVAPRPMRADGGQVETLVSRLSEARMTEDPAAQGNTSLVAERFNKGTRIAVAKVTDGAGVHEIEVRKAPEGDYFARSTAEPGFHKVTTAVGEGLDKGLDDLRNKKLFDFAFSEPGKIELVDAGKTMVFEKSGEKWMRAGKPVDAVALRALIDKLRDLSASAFPDKGFTEPIAELKVTWEGGQRTDHVLISKSSQTYFAKRQGEPAIYVVESPDIDTTLDTARHIQDEAPAPAEPKATP